MLTSPWFYCSTVLGASSGWVACGDEMKWVFVRACTVSDLWTVELWLWRFRCGWVELLGRGLDQGRCGFCLSPMGAVSGCGCSNVDGWNTIFCFLFLFSRGFPYEGCRVGVL